MAWIRTEEVGVPGIIGVMSINQAMMEAVRNLNQSITFGGFGVDAGRNEQQSPFPQGQSPERPAPARC